MGVLSLYLGLRTFRRHPLVDVTVTVLVFVINGGWLLHTFVSLFREYQVVKIIKSVYRFMTCQEKKDEVGHMKDSKVSTDPHIASSGPHDLDHVSTVDDGSTISRAGGSSKVLIGMKEGSKDRVGDGDGDGRKGKGAIKERAPASKGKDVVNPLSLGVEMTNVTKSTTSKSEVMNPLSLGAYS